MVIVQLNGGLGNQMFQYACGRALAERLSTTLKLDLSAYETYSLRHYGLHCFQIIEQIATPGEIAAVKGLHRHERIGLKVARKIGSRLADAYLGLDGKYVKEESVFIYDPKVRQLTGNVYLEGYWQSERYFVDIRDILLREFSIKYAPGGIVRHYLNEITSTNSISVHVRRSDYVSNPVANEFHGVCNLDYYRRASDFIANRVKEPHLYVFSDDLPWVRENLALPYPITIVGGRNSLHDFDDLRLMMQCRHHIIANSSFSWWGAWLSTNEDTIVVAPAQWYANPKVSTPDILPPNWITI